MKPLEARNEPEVDHPYQDHPLVAEQGRADHRPNPKLAVQRVGGEKCTGGKSSEDPKLSPTLGLKARWRRGSDLRVTELAQDTVGLPRGTEVLDTA